MNVDLPIWKLLFIKEKDTRKLFLEVGMRWLILLVCVI